MEHGADWLITTSTTRSTIMICVAAAAATELLTFSHFRTTLGRAWGGWWAEAATQHPNNDDGLMLVSVRWRCGCVPPACVLCKSCSSDEDELTNFTRHARHASCLGLAVRFGLEKGRRTHVPVKGRDCSHDGLCQGTHASEPGRVMRCAIEL